MGTSKLLLIGLGNWGQAWAKTLYKINALGAISDPSPEASTEAQAFPEIPFFNTYTDALSQVNIDGVVIATPAETHFNIALNCIQLGFPTLVEKPMTLDPQQALLLEKEANQQNIPLAVGHLLLYHPAICALKEAINNDQLGDILAIQSTRSNFGKIRNQENAWWSLAPHDLSIALYLLNEPLKLLNAHGSCWLKRTHLYDSVTAWFTTPQQTEVRINVSWLHPYKHHELIVTGSKGIALFNPQLPPQQQLVFKNYTLTKGSSSYHIATNHLSQEIPIHFDQTILPLDKQAQTFLECIQTQAKLINSGHHGYQVIQLLQDVDLLLTKAKQPCT